MAGTTFTLQLPTKRKRDLNHHDNQEVETDTRQQTCLECTLSWPWVIFHRNQDGSRNEMFYLLGYKFTTNESISKARKKMLRIDPTAPVSTSSASTPLSTTPNEGQGQGSSHFTTAQAPATTLYPNSNTNTNGQGLQNHPSPPIPYHNQYQYQPPPQPQPQSQPQPQNQYQPNHNTYGPQMIAPQYQDQYGQPLFNPAQAFGYNFNLNNSQPQPQGMMYHQPPPQHPQLQPQQHQPQQQPQQTHLAVQYQPPPPPPQTQSQSQPLTQPQSQNVWIQLFRQTEPARAMNCLPREERLIPRVQMNYHPAAGAPPIPQMELYKHYASTIPRQGFPPLLQGREFILGVAKHFEGVGVHLDKGTFTIGGLWRRNQPVATLH